MCVCCYHSGRVLFIYSNSSDAKVSTFIPRHNMNVLLHWRLG